MGLLPGAQSEEDRPDPNHYASGSSQEAHQGEAGKKKLLSVLERHVQRHCASQAVAEKYPYLKDLKQEDFDYFAQISQLDIETKTEIELGKHIKNYNKVKLLLDPFFESY